MDLHPYHNDPKLQPLFYVELIRNHATNYDLFTFTSNSTKLFQRQYSSDWRSLGIHCAESDSSANASILLKEWVLSINANNGWISLIY